MKPEAKTHMLKSKSTERKLSIDTTPREESTLLFYMDQTTRSF
jgi:hypothetical protein